MLDRGGAAPAGQDRRMDVDASKTGPRQDGGRQDEPIRGHHEHVERDRQQGAARLFAAKRRRLDHGDAALLRERLDRRRLHGKPAPARAIGLRQHHRHRVIVVENGRQRERREGRSAGEADPQRVHERRWTAPYSARASWRSFFFCLADTRARFSGER